MERRRPPTATVGALSLVALGWFDTGSDLAADARSALEDASFGQERDALAEPPELQDVYGVATTRDDEPIYVPVVGVDLGTEEEPDRDAAYAIAATIAPALDGALREEHVRQYDLVFSYGERSWFSTTDRRRISVTPELAARVAREPSFGAPELRSAIERADDGDDLLPPVGWGHPLPHSYYHGSDDTAATVAGAGFF